MPSLKEVFRRDEIVEAIVFEGVYPPIENNPSLTYFGGRPTVAPGFKWPTNRGFPQVFIGQIDLARLPSVPQSASLPKSGLLQFFIGADAESGSRYLVVHNDASREVLREAGPNKPYGELGREFPKWFMTPLACPTRSCNRSKEAATLIMDRFPLEPDQTGPERVSWLADERFPYVWGGVSLWLRAVQRSLGGTLGAALGVGYDFTPPGQRESPRKGYEVLRKAYDKWESRAKTRPPLAPMSTDEILEFRKIAVQSPGNLAPVWGLQIMQITRATFGCVVDDILRGPKSGWGVLTPAAIRMNTARHKPKVWNEYNDYWCTYRHQMFGWKQGGLYDDDPFDPGDHVDLHILMQFSTDDAFDWSWGDIDDLIFSISEDDLRNRRWDKVQMAMHAEYSGWRWAGSD